MEIDDRDRVGQGLGDGVMIGDNGIDPQGLRVRHLVDGGYPVIYRNDQLYTALIQPRDRLTVHPVALGLTRGDIVHRVRADIGQIGVQQRGRRNAVGVKVAVDADALTVLDRRLDPLDRLVHILDLKRRCGECIIRQKVDDRVFIGDAADIEQHGEQHGQVIALRDGDRVVFIQFSGHPFFHLPLLNVL